VSTNRKFASRCLGESEKHAKPRSVARRGILETDRKMGLISTGLVKMIVLQIVLLTVSGDRRKISIEDKFVKF
jgi:hypothetical protein